MYSIHILYLNTLFIRKAVLILIPDNADPCLALIKDNLISFIIKEKIRLIIAVALPCAMDNFTVGKYIRLAGTMYAKSEITMIIPGFTVTDLKHNIADSKLLTVHIILVCSA